MADDTPGALSVVDGTTVPQRLLVGIDPIGLLAYQMLPRVRGGIVTDANPFPVVDAAADAALGAPADAAWSAGSGTIVSLLKAAVGFLSALGRTFTFAAGSASMVVTGGTAVVAISGPVKGGYITNPLLLADQGGIAALEALIVDPVTAPSTASGNANGTAVPLAPGQSWVLPGPIPAGQNVRANAATAGHKFTVVTWS